MVNEMMKNSRNIDVPPIAGQGMPKPARPNFQNAYVILKAFTFPAGLYGGNSVVFFIDHGAPKPKGNPGHSAVYDFNTLQCKGVRCGH